MAEKMNIPVLGVAENMSYVTRPDRKEDLSVRRKTSEIAGKHGIPKTISMPVMPDHAALR